MAKKLLLATLLLALSVLGFKSNQTAFAALPPGNAIKDPYAILRNALPIEQKELRELQTKLEETSNSVRGNRWSSVQKDVAASESLLSRSKNRILDAIPQDRKEKGAIFITRLSQNIEKLLEISSQQDKSAFIELRSLSLKEIGDIEALLLKDDFPYSIPKEFDDLPRLLGRASVSIDTTKGNMKAVIDGYNAPLTGGAFIDLVLKGFYDGLPFIRAEDFYVLQTGDPSGPEIGYIDPITKEERHVPLEIRAPKEQETLYNQTFDDAGLAKETPTLPFATLGTLGWAHSSQAIDDGSSQFFFFLYEAELTPAGRNLIDGRNAAFGYVVEGAEIIEKLGVEDKISSIKILNGKDHFQEHV